MFFVPGNNAVIEHISGHQGVLAVVELDESYLAVGIDKGLLVDSADTLQL
jgi:hypothetical protein